MALAFDAFSNVAAGTGNLSWTHTPVGTPRAVIVLIVQNTGTNEVSGVTYGGTSMTAMTGSPNLKAATEALATYAFLLGASVPTGPQTVTVTVSGASTKRAGAITLTGAANVVEQDTDVTINSNSLANPSAILVLGGNSCFCCEMVASGQPALIGITELAGWTNRLEHDFTNQTGGWYTYNTIGTADVTMGWTQTADDAVCIGIAVKEEAAPPPTTGGTLLTLGVG